MRSFENLTIVSIMGNESYIQGSIYAIQRSCEQLPGSKGLLISPPLPQNVVLPSNIEHKVVAPFGYMEYNIFVLYQLDAFIDTDYCIIVQNDGWVLNGKNWRDEFWDYDYIGAPNCFYGYYDEQGNYQQKQSYDEPYPLPTGSPLRQIQNGGFSFRSKKLLGLPQKLALPYVVDAPETANPNQFGYKINWKNSGHNEDNFITAKYRHIFEQNGIKFAPAEIAHHFSMENTIMHQSAGKHYLDILGGHFIGNCRLIGLNKVEILVSAEKFGSEQALMEHIHSRIDVFLFKHCGYDIQALLTK